MHQIASVTLIVVLFTLPVAGKRVPPRSVTPVVANGVEYSADGDGRNGYVVAMDVASGRELWKVKVFHVRIKFWVEEDVQWVYITNLRLVGNALLVRDEKARCYSVDIKNRHVVRRSAGMPSRHCLLAVRDWRNIAITLSTRTLSVDD